MKIADLKTQLANTSEPMTQFTQFFTEVGEAARLDVTIESTGPMLVDVCHSLTSDATHNIFVDTGNPLSVFLNVPIGECRTLGANAGQSFSATINQSFDDDAKTVFVVRTTPSAEVTVDAVTVDED